MPLPARGCRGLLVPALLVLAALFLMDRAASAVEAPQESIIVTDIVGRQVQVTVPVRRVLLGEGRQLYIAAMLDREDPAGRIVGWRDDLKKADPDTYAQYARKYPALDELPTFGGVAQGAFDVEQAVALAPDVLFLNYEAETAAEEARFDRKLGALGIPVIYVDFRHKPMENTEASVRLFGRIFGREERAEEFLTFRREQIARVTDVIRDRQPARPKIFIERIGGYTEDCCLTFGHGNFGTLVEMAGGVNIAADRLPGTFGQLNPEYVLLADPDQVVVTSARWEAYVPGGNWIGVGPSADLAEDRRKLEGYLAKPAYAGIRAARTRRFHAIWHQFYNSPFQFVALQQLARWFHPDLFPGLDPDATFRRLHERFLPVPYELGYFVSLE